jgi:tryptophanyl-tRNA synthetase|uniref:Tryptophan--tRNA ligase n=1 Tax=candidate division WOR-3 bacterium TaxID=2052148 RepID=A0A7C6ECJ8_UNCW3
MQKKRILTGDRPTGPLHLGHYVGSLVNRVKLQKDYDEFIIIADVQALTTNFDHPEKLKEDVYNVCLDYLSVGIDPNLTTIFIQSQVPEIAELTIYYSMFTPVSLLRYNPTIKTEAKQYGYDAKGMTYGFLGYPVSQAADITFCRAHLVPVGADQVPHIELTRKIVRRFNELYAPVLVEPEALVGDIPRLVGLDGNAKMSKSLGNCIYLADSKEDVAKKVNQAVTDPARIHAKDPGHPEVCNVFTYQKAFNPKFIPELEANCRAGKIGCVSCKKTLITAINELLEPIRERRSKYEKDRDLVTQILIQGTKRACEEAKKTMALVRDAMKINYFKLS